MLAGGAGHLLSFGVVGIRKSGQGAPVRDESAAEEG